MADRILTTCPYCGKPHTVTTSTFESDASFPSVEVSSPRSLGSAFWPAFWSSDAGTNVIAAFLPAGFTWLICYTYGYPLWWSAAVGVLAGLGLPVLKLVLTRPVFLQPKSNKVLVDVAIVDRSDGGYTLALDSFNPDKVEWLDLQRLSKARTFSRSAAVSAGLSQDKWHKIKDEFLRLNYCVPMPNGQNGYSLTIRGRHLLLKIRDRQQTTTNNKE